MSHPFDIRDRAGSFRHAIRGILHMLMTQHNAWLHALATVLVTAAGFFFALSAGEWCWIVASMGTVWTAEALNTAIESLADAITKEHHPLIGQAKDTAAGAVLIAAICAAIVGSVIFLPHILRLIRETAQSPA